MSTKKHTSFPQAPSDTWPLALVLEISMAYNMRYIKGKKPSPYVGDGWELIKGADKQVANTKNRLGIVVAFTTAVCSAEALKSLKDAVTTFPSKDAQNFINWRTILTR